MCRDSRTRTCGLLLPKQAPYPRRYPDCQCIDHYPHLKVAAKVSACTPHTPLVCASRQTQLVPYRVIFYLGHQRYRYSHGKAIGLALKPNSHLEPHRSELATELLLAFKQALDRGWRPDQDERPVTLLELLSSYSPAPDHSEKYRKAMIATRDGFQAICSAKGSCPWSCNN